MTGRPNPGRSTSVGSPHRRVGDWRKGYNAQDRQNVRPTGAWMTGDLYENNTSIQNGTKTE